MVSRRRDSHSSSGGYDSRRPLPAEEEEEREESDDGVNLAATYVRKRDGTQRRVTGSARRGIRPRPEPAPIDRRWCVSWKTSGVVVVGTNADVAVEMTGTVGAAGYCGDMMMVWVMVMLSKR